MNRRWFVMLCTENPSPLHFQEKGGVETPRQPTCTCDL